MDGKPQRVGSGNVIDDVTIASNEIKATTRGITLSAADLPLPETDGAGFDSNRIQNASIRDNTIGSYTEAGVQLWAGFSNTGSFSLTVSRNSLQFISVTNDRLDSSPLKKAAVGIAVFGGDARNGATSRENTIRGLTISGNRASGNNAGVSFIGGIGSQSRGNTIDVVNFNANVLGANDVAVTAVENMNSASGNSVRFPRRRAVR
jgi:hypothetical protein